MPLLPTCQLMAEVGWKVARSLSRAYGLKIAVFRPGQQQIWILQNRL